MVWYIMNVWSTKVYSKLAENKVGETMGWVKKHKQFTFFCSDNL